MGRKKDINIDKNSLEYKRLYQRYYYYKRRLNLIFKLRHNKMCLDYYYKKNNKTPKNPKPKTTKLKIKKCDNIPSDNIVKNGIINFD
jgi:hypothetical protein